MKKIIFLLSFLLGFSNLAFGQQVSISPIINSCVTIGANTTYTTSPVSISGYEGYIGYSFTAVDASGKNFTQTNAYLVYQVWDNLYGQCPANSTSYYQGIPNTNPILYGSNSFPATSAWQITGNSQSASSITAKKGSIQPPVSTCLLWSIINLGGNSLTVCTLNMIGE